MAQLTESDQKVYDLLTKEERQKFWQFHYKDEGIKNELEEANLEWDYETDSTAVRYLRKLKGLKSSSVSFGNGLSGKVDGEASVNAAKNEYSSLEEEEEDDGETSDSNISNDQHSGAELLGKPNGNERLRDLVGSSISIYPKTALRGVVEIRGNRDGLYSQVSKGYLSGPSEEVAVKMINASLKDMREEEIRIIRKLGGLGHRNLISMIGILDSAITQPMELLFDYRDFDTSLLDFVKDDKNPKDYATFGKFSLDILNACEYLHKNGIVHGSLAARNVIIRTAKRKYNTNSKSHFKTHFNALLSDCGIIHFSEADEKFGYEYFKASNGTIVPLRWVAEEILGSDDSSNYYTPQSDVWSVGIVLWEMWTYGDVPYGNLSTNREVEGHILNGCSPLTFQKPTGCPKHILKVMESIFVEAAERPTMSDLVKKYEDFRNYKQELPTETMKEKNSVSTSKRKFAAVTDSSYRPNCRGYQNQQGQHRQNEGTSDNQKQNFNRQHQGGGDGILGRCPEDKNSYRAQPYARPKVGFNKGPRKYYDVPSKLVPVLCPASMFSGGSNKSNPFALQSMPPVSLIQTLQNSITSLENQVQAMTVARAHVQPSSSVSVNIGNPQPSTSTRNATQRPVSSQSGQAKAKTQSQGQGLKGNRNTSVTKRNPTTNKNKQNQIQ